MTLTDGKERISEETPDQNAVIRDNFTVYRQEDSEATLKDEDNIVEPACAATAGAGNTLSIKTFSRSKTSEIEVVYDFF